MSTISFDTGEAGAPRHGIGASPATGRRRDLTADAKADIIDAVYAAAMDPARWTELIERFTAWLGGAGSIYVRPSSDPGASRLLATSFDPDFTRSYNDYYNSRNIWVTSDTITTSPLVTSEEVLCPEDLERQEFYSDWLAPQDLRHGISCELTSGGGQTLSLALVRSGRLGEITPAEVSFLEELLPHLRRAAEIANRLETLETRSEASFAALERLGMAAVLLDSGCQVVFANGMADQLLRRGAGLRAPAGRLAAYPAAVDGRLRAAVAAATGMGREVQGRSGSIISVPRAQVGVPLSLSISPVDERDRPGVGQGPLALVLISDPEHARPVTESNLRARYELTPAEARLAAALCSGQTLSGYAAGTGVSVTTAKYHLEAVFGKVGENRQVDLVRRIVSDPVLQCAA